MAGSQGLKPQFSTQDNYSIQYSQQTVCALTVGLFVSSITPFLADSHGAHRPTRKLATGAGFEPARWDYRFRHHIGLERYRFSPCP